MNRRNRRKAPGREQGLNPGTKGSQETQEGHFRFISHQLKSPIHAIESLLKTVAEGLTGEIDPRALNLIERAVGRAAEARAMVSDLLDYQLLSRGDAVPQQELELVSLINALLIRYASLASEGGVSLKSQLPLKRRVLLRGDRRGLEQAIRNILENAVQYTPAQGTITVSLSLAANPPRCRLTIRDTGYGIPPADLDRVFQPFYRSIKHKSNIPGTGLGLPITKKVIEQHGGRISLDSVENQGTTFQVELPYDRLQQVEEKLIPGKKVVIIGGVTAGPKVAARLRRLDEDLDITIVEKSQFLSYSGCGLPYYISGRVRSPQALMSTADNTIRDVHFFESIKNITILNNTVARQIDRKKKQVRLEDCTDRKQHSLPYDILVLATGAAPIIPQIPGIRQQGIYTLYSMDDAEAIKSEVSNKSAQDVCIIGGGLIGISTAESLAGTGARVTILEKRPCILLNLLDSDMALKIQNHLNRKGIKIITGVEISEIRRRKQQYHLLTSQGVYLANLIILSTGVMPNISLARKADLEIGEAGGIKVNQWLQSSDPDIYAVGDCAESIDLITGRNEYWPLGSVSTKMGRIAADNISGRKRSFQGSVGTALFTIMDINAARTGLTLENARRRGFDAQAVTITGLDRAHFTPESRYITLKIIADRPSKVILGAQGYGKGEVVAKIEILACAIAQKMTLDQVFTLDLGYAPAFNNSIDILQTACLVLENKIEGLVRTVTLEEWEKIQNQVPVIDVSPLSEHARGSIPGSISIPLENLRLEGIPYDKEIRVVLYSKTSSGAYKAYRYLSSQGYRNLYVLEGGYVYWES